MVAKFLFACFLLVFAFQTSYAQASFDLTAIGYDSHTDLKWTLPTSITPTQYRVYRKAQGGNFEIIATQTERSKIDFIGPLTADYQYFIGPINGIGNLIGSSDTVSINISPKSDEELMTMVQAYTFRYFWEFGHPISGMARERNTSGDIVTSGGTGFGVMSIIVAIERGFITHEQGLARMLQITGFLEFADSFHGVFPHWMNGTTGNVVPFSQYDNGGDLVETAFLMQGLLCARQYFDGTDATETALRQSITGLWEAVEWDWYRKNNSNTLYWHWSPNYGWQMNFQIHGFNEAMIIYMLAIASPTHGVPASLYESGWATTGYESGLTWYGQNLAVGPPLGGPLFFAHYSYLGFDPRNKKDAYCNYFQRNRAHTLINRSFCIANPLNHDGYSDVCWGLTASDDPFGYTAHEALGSKDNGTITPTAALSSMPYTPAESMDALKHFYRQKGQNLWGPMGFYDAFNETENWWADSYLAIDQGPIIVMIENHRTKLLWDLFMANPEIQPMLDAVGFVPDITGNEEVMPVSFILSPNPTQDQVMISGLSESDFLSYSLYDLNGKMLLSGTTLGFSVSLLPRGVYQIKVVTKSGESASALVKE
jgi:hypothetical protein